MGVEPMTDAEIGKLLTEPSTITLSPGYEGANIGTYIGFKHVNYLVEKAVIEHFRFCGLPIGELYERHGLGFDVIDLESHLRGGLFVDDLVEFTVTPVGGEYATEFIFEVSISTVRDGSRKKIATSTVRAVLRRDEDDRRLPSRTAAPAALQRFTVDRIGDGELGDLAPTGARQDLISGGTTDQDPVLNSLLTGKNGYGWKFRIPYPYVHYFSRMHMSSYLRQMEEAKHRFAAARGISIGSQLAQRNWIPAVTHSRIEILGEALLEEDLYTTYTVESVFKTLLYTARMDCYVVRDGHLVKVATGPITHGYGIVEDGNQARIVQFDDTVLAALTGDGSSRP
jgi:acyl-CoA thioesterase FadM